MWIASAAISSGLLPASSPKWYGLSGVDDLLDDLAQLVHFDGKHAAIDVLVVRLADRLD